MGISNRMFCMVYGYDSLLFEFLCFWFFSYEVANDGHIFF